jgi:hypothetical protein
MLEHCEQTAKSRKLGLLAWLHGSPSRIVIIEKLRESDGELLEDDRPWGRPQPRTAVMAVSRQHPGTEGRDRLAW